MRTRIGIAVARRAKRAFGTFGIASHARARKAWRTRRALSFVYLLLPSVLAFLVVLPAVCSGEVDWSLGADVGKKPAQVKLSPLEMGSVNEIWAEIIAGSYHVTVPFVNSLYERSYDFDEVALMLEMAQASKKDPSDIAVLRKKGLGWGAIAKQLGVHPAAMEKAKGKESLFRRYVLARCLAGYYGIPDSETLVLLSEKGYDFGEIAIAVNVSAHSGAPLREVVAARATGAKWRIVAEKFKMQSSQLGKPPATHPGGKVGGQGTGKTTETTNKKKGGGADCSKTCSKKCY